MYQPAGINRLRHPAIVCTVVPECFSSCRRRSLHGKKPRKKAWMEINVVQPSPSGKVAHFCPFLKTFLLNVLSGSPGILNNQLIGSCNLNIKKSPIYDTFLGSRGLQKPTPMRKCGTTLLKRGWCVAQKRRSRVQHGTSSF